MNKKTDIAFIIIAIIVTPLLLLGIYLFAPVLLIGDDVQSKVVQVQAINRTPTNYKTNFAKWEYTQDPSTGLLTATLQSQFGQEEEARPGVITEDGSYGRHVTDLDAFKASLRDKQATDKTAALLLKMVEAIETQGGPTMQKCNVGNLAIAIVANCQNEGKPFEWEGTDKWTGKSTSGISATFLKNGSWFETEGSNRNVFVNGTDTTVGVMLNSNDCVMTRAQHIKNAATLWRTYGESHPLFSGIGCGMVQWTGSRCGAYIDYMDKLKLTDAQVDTEDERMDIDIAYLMKDYESYMKKYLSTTDYESISVESLAGWTTSKYETPYHSACFHYANKDNPEVAVGGRTLEVYTENGDSFLVTSRDDFFDGTVTDFSAQHYWRWKEGGQVQTAKVAESTRVRYAIELYNKYYGEGS